MLKIINKNISKYLLFYILAVAALLSIISFVFYFSHNQINLSYGDAVSRLNISRKLIDNLNPGLAQIGSVWLPLPFILMLPFIWINYFWHTGIAGYIVSGSSFILTVYYLYRYGYELFSSKYSGFIMAAVAFTSINLLYLQTTAMSESIFIASIVGATFYLHKWAKEFRISYLIFAALFVSASTFIRYEGYFLFLFSVVLVFIISYIKKRSFKATEGKLIIFSTLAVTGIILWFIYNWAVFGNPLYWKDIYSGKNDIISSEVGQSVPEALVSHNLSLDNLFKSTSLFWDSTAVMNGVIITSIVTFALFIFIFLLIKNKDFLKKPEELVNLLPFSVFIFIVFTLFVNNFPLTMPNLTFNSLLHREISMLGEYNIRYGISILPLIAIFLGWISYRIKFGKVIVGVALLFQIITTFWTPFYTVYQLPANLIGNNSSRSTAINPGSVWLKKNYDSGLIMISAQNHNPEMFYLGIDYKNYIHEGAGKYWLESRSDPQKYATWIYMYVPPKNSTTNDYVTKYIANNAKVPKYYDVVYSDNLYIIYKLKNNNTLDTSL